MSNISRRWIQEVVLPDGSIAECSADIDNYIKANQVALASDYSPEYYAKVKNRQEKEQRNAIFTDLINNYKRSIWNEK